MPRLGTQTQTNAAHADILDLVDNLVPLLPIMKDIIEAWATSLTNVATTASVAGALQTPLTANAQIFDRYKNFLRTRFGIDLNVTPFGSLTDPQRKQVLQAADAYLGILLNLALLAKQRLDEA